MTNTRFKTMMYNGEYVDVNLLNKGIYACSKPFIYDREDTIESLVDRAIKSNGVIGSLFFSKAYLANLKECTLEHMLIIL